MRTGRRPVGGAQTELGRAGRIGPDPLEEPPGAANAAVPIERNVTAAAVMVRTRTVLSMQVSCGRGWSGAATRALAATQRIGAATRCDHDR